MKEQLIATKSIILEESKKNVNKNDLSPYLDILLEIITWTLKNLIKNGKLKIRIWDYPKIVAFFISVVKKIVSVR